MFNWKILRCKMGVIGYWHNIAIWIKFAWITSWMFTVSIQFIITQ